MLSIILFFTFLCVLLTYIYTEVERRQSYWERKAVKHLKPRFLLGSFSLIPSKHWSETTRNIYSHFPEERYHGFYQYLQPTLMIRDPKLVQEIMVTNFEYFTDRRDIVSDDSDPFWSRNLFAANGEKWRQLRSTLSPSFTGNKMRIMFDLMQECATEFVDYLKAKNDEVIEFEAKDLFSRYTNDVIATTAFGVKVNSLNNPDNDFFQMGMKASKFDASTLLKFLIYGTSPLLAKLLRIKLIPANVTEYFTEIIKNTLEIRNQNKITRPDMIQLLMEAQNKNPQITIDDIISQAFIFFLAGFETVSSLLSFAFYELALNPSIQARLREEFDRVEEPLTFEALHDLKYLDMVICETLRKWPSGVLTDRKVTKPYTIHPTRPNEVPLHLEKGTIVWLPMLAIQNDPKNYSEPENFDPERFSKERRSKMNLDLYFPFGLGPRACIGSRFALLESKLLVYYVLKTFEIIRIEKTPVPVVLDKKQINLGAKGGLWLGLKKL